jgi:mono/diheme cytochrome c family protein
MRHARLGSLARARLALATLVLLPACTVLPPLDLQRMISQDRFTVWDGSPYLPDGRELQAPPEGAIARDAPTLDSPKQTGVESGAYLATIPMPLTRDLVVLGKARFETFCAPCHGIRGNGVSVAATNMDLRRPPAIAGRAARALPPGRIYQVINEGYGLMRPYAEDLSSPEERWAVVAYLRALEISQGTSLDALPGSVREEAERHLR